MIKLITIQKNTDASKKKKSYVPRCKNTIVTTYSNNVV